MKRLFSRTRIEAVGAGSDWFRRYDKGLVAQLEPNPVKAELNLLIEYWPDQADKDADLRETEGQAEAETPRWPELEAYLQRLATPAKTAKAPEARAEAETSRWPETEVYLRYLAPVLVFVRGPQNLWGFVDKMEDDGSYTTCSSPMMARDFGTPDRAYAATEKMRAYETENHNWDQDYFVLAHERTLKAVRRMPGQEPGSGASHAAGKGNR